MAREAAIVSTWTTPVAGREAKSIEVFMEFLGFWGKLAAEGRCSEPRVYFTIDGSGGMAIVEGRSDVLQEVLESEEFEKLVSKGLFIVNDLKIQMAWTGDEVQRSTQIYAEAGHELGYW